MNKTNGLQLGYQRMCGNTCNYVIEQVSELQYYMLCKIMLGRARQRSLGNRRHFSAMCVIFAPTAGDLLPVYG